MNKYGQIAINTVQLLQANGSSTYELAWNEAASQIFRKGTSSYDKSCPKNAFVGLCETGLVRGVSIENAVESESKLQKNKEYAIRAVELLKANPQLAANKNSLWEVVMNGVVKQHNAQMDVVLALWEKDLISLSNE
jgi:hypothetical protein